MIDVKGMNRDAFSDERKAVILRVTFNGTQVISSESVISAKLQEDLADQNITIGSAFSQSFELKMRMPDPGIPLTGAYLTAEASFDGTNWAKLGKFYANTVSTTDNYKTVSITATDRMALLTDAYTPAIDFPATPQEIIADIANQYNLMLDTGISYANISVPQLYEGTVRDYIGWIAGLSGKNARFNREGKLTFIWYHQIVAVYGDVNLDDAIDAKDIAYINENLLGSASREDAEAILGRMIVGKAYIGAKLKDTTRAPLADVNQDGIINDEDVAEVQGYIDGTPYDPTLVGTVAEYIQLLDENRIEINGFRLSASETYTISALVSGTEESSVESGAGKAISFYNPFMTKAVLDQIAAKNLPFTYLAAKISYRGCPSWEVGDIIRTQAGGSWNVPIMSQTLEFSAKLSGEIKSLGLSDEEENAIRVVPDVKEVERQLPKIKQVLTDINSSLLSGTDGYMILDEEEIGGVKRLVGFKLMDTPTINPTTKGWLANKNGIGWSDDGFKTISKLGLDMANGKIYADQIAAGAVITNSFQIGDAMSFDGATGEIIFGSKVKMSWQSVEEAPDFVTEETATQITNNAITTATIRADQVEAGAFNLQNGTFFVESNSKDETMIQIKCGEFVADIRAQGATFTRNGEGAGIGYDGISAPNITTQSFWCNGNALISNGSLQAASILYGGEELATLFAPVAHGHSQYYESGDNIHANYLYIASLGSASQQALYCSTNSGIVGTDSSSRRYKNSIKDVADEMLRPERLYDLPIRQFKWNEGHFDDAEEYNYDTVNVGFIAEEVAEFYPYAAVISRGQIESWEVRRILPPMLALIQAQKKEIDEIKEEMRRLIS